MLEIACFTSSSAITAAKAGADRLEICTSYSQGGLTPSLKTLYHISRSLKKQIPKMIMIRPRAGNFAYSPSEFDAMRNDIVRLKPFASGFVFGILDCVGKVDVARCSELLDLADPLPCTFHRAVDEVGDYELAVEQVVTCGFKNILTSGGAKTAGEGAERVAKMVEKYGDRVQFVIAGGIRNGNAVDIKKRAGVQWMHSAAITAEGEECDGEEVKKIKALISTNDTSSDVTMS